MSYITTGSPVLPTGVAKLIVPALVMGTKEKNTAVRADCEYALIHVLHLRKGDAILKVSQ